jgi:predicted acylesterase/phospholipase RssA
MERLLAERDALQLSGGGFKTLAFCGALEGVDMRRFRAIGGVSAGSILALAFVLGYQPSEAKDLLGQADLMQALAQTASPFRALAEGSFFDQGPMLAVLAQCMRAKGFPADGDFEALHRHTNGRSLRVVVCTTGAAPRLRVLDERTSPKVQVLRAIKASTAVPFAFPPVQVSGDLCIDAGTLNNLSLFAVGECPSKTLGLLAGRDHSTRSLVPHCLSQLAASGMDRMDFLVDAEIMAHTRRARVVRMPMVPSPDYHLFRLGDGSRADMERLVQQGREAMRAACSASELATLLCVSVGRGLGPPDSQEQEP